MRPLLADAINFGFVFGVGIIVLIPLMAFEVFAEAFVLKKTWRLPFRQLCGLTFATNFWSLLAGIPTKILNGYLYSILLPQDIPGFFRRYPLAITLGSLIYFAVTVLVEGAYAIRWARRKQVVLSKKQIWWGMLLANLATYIVLSPLYYLDTKPYQEVHRFSNDTRWTTHPATILFINYPDRHLQSIRTDGSGLKTLVPFPLADYLISSNLNICLFRSTNGDLYLYRHDTGKTNLIWKTTEHYFMDQIAFSPSGERVAFVSAKEKTVQIVTPSSGKRQSLPLTTLSNYDTPSCVWSPDERNFYVGNDESNRVSVTIQTNGDATITQLKDTNVLPTLTCYGRIGKGGQWSSGDDWGELFDSDKCGNFEAASEPGLGSSLRISRPEGQSNRHVLTVAVNPGLLHLGDFGFEDVAFLDDCNECVFESNGYIYLLGITEKRLGTLAKGDRFIRLTSRFAK